MPGRGPAGPSGELKFWKRSKRCYSRSLWPDGSWGQGSDRVQEGPPQRVIAIPPGPPQDAVVDPGVLEGAHVPPVDVVHQGYAPGPQVGPGEVRGDAAPRHGPALVGVRQHEYLLRDTNAPDGTSPFHGTAFVDAPMSERRSLTLLRTLLTTPAVVGGAVETLNLPPPLVARVTWKWGRRWLPALAGAMGARSRDIKDLLRRPPPAGPCEHTEGCLTRPCAMIAWRIVFASALSLLSGQASYHLKTHTHTPSHG